MIQIGRPETVVPSQLLPPSCAPLRANNNLDVCQVGDLVFLAWRTAPIHFASRAARLEVIAEHPDGHWTHETTIAMGRDVREPRLVYHNGRLFLYFFPAGMRPTRFEPDRIHVSERLEAGAWTAPVAVSPADHVVWRVRSIGDRLVMACYSDASGAYTTDRAPRAHLWTSADGLEWEPMFTVEADRNAFEAGTSETDFLMLPGGEALTVSRLESRGSGLGTILARLGSDGQVLAKRLEERKFDSPAIFEWGDDIWLVTRRQRAFGGKVGLMPSALPSGLRDLGNQGLYWLTPKATCLYRIDPDSLAVEEITDLPGCGDTAFASILGGGEADRVTVYNYSSPSWMRNAPWVAGQLMPTHIYRADLMR